MNEQTNPAPATILDDAGCIAADLRCIQCGYNLRTQPVTGRCPECGQAVGESVQGLLPQLDRKGHIARDVPCLGCGYNLRTQPATGICPECAAPVARSARFHYLHLAPPRWVRRQANGALLLIIALCGAAGSWIVTVIISFTTPTVVLGFIPPMLMIVIGGVALWFVTRGLLQLTTPDPTAQSRREGFSARKLVRCCLIALPMLILTSLAVVLLGPWPPQSGISLTFSPVPFLLSALAGLAYFVLPMATLRHIATLMRRIPRRRLVIFAKIEFWGLLASGVLYVYVGSCVVFFFVTCWAFAPAVGGSNMPVPRYTAAPYSPNAVTTTSAPASTAPGYPPTAPATVTYTKSRTTTVTYTRPGGVTTTTTMPVSVPAGMAVAPPFSPLFFLRAQMRVGRYSLIGLFIAGLVLLILVQRALAQAARLAEANITHHQTPAEAPRPSP